MYPIGAKLDFHAFMGPEGQYKYLFKQDDSLFQKERKSETGALMGAFIMAIRASN